MNIQEFKDKATSLDSQMEALKAEFANLKPSFEKIITDQSIPLKERWDFWCKADNELKNHESDVVCLDRVTREARKVLFEDLDMPEVYGRGKRIDVTDHCSDWAFKERWLPKCMEDKETHDAALESILKKNLGSFCYDW